MTERFFRLYTKIRKHPVMKDPVALQLLVWLFCEAKDEERGPGDSPRKVDHNDGDYPLRREEVTVNYRGLSVELAQPASTLHRKMGKLRRWLIVRTESASSFTLVTLCNWDDSQPQWNASGTQVERNRNAGGTQVERPNRRVEQKKQRTYPPEFGLIWAEYPRNEDKSPALDVWVRKGRPSPEVVIAGINRWKLTKSWQDGFVPYLRKFLSHRNWEDTPKPAQVESREETKAGERDPEYIEALLKKRGATGA